MHEHMIHAYIMLAYSSLQNFSRSTGVTFAWSRLDSDGLPCTWPKNIWKFGTVKAGKLGI